MFIIKNYNRIYSSIQSLDKNARLIVVTKNQNLDKIEMFWLSSNPATIDIIHQDLGEMNWCWLSRNPSAIHLLKENQDKIDWEVIWENPAIYEYDYKSMTRPFTEELMANRFHPNNLHKFEAWGYE